MKTSYIICRARGKRKLQELCSKIKNFRLGNSRAGDQTRAPPGRPVGSHRSQPKGPASPQVSAGSSYDLAWFQLRGGGGVSQISDVWIFVYAVPSA